MKTVLITGAAKGLGLDLSRAFLDGGWSVIATGRDAADIPQDVSTNPKAKALSLDVTDESSIRNVSVALSNVPIDVLINNAGIYDSPSVDDDSAVRDMDHIIKVFRTNSIGPKFVSEALADNLEKGGEKLVVTISSGMGTYAQLFGEGMTSVSRGKSDVYTASHWAYSASKTAANYSMLCFHVLHPNIKSVLINPGWIRSI